MRVPGDRQMMINSLQVKKSRAPYQLTPGKASYRLTPEYAAKNTRTIKTATKYTATENFSCNVAVFHSFTGGRTKGATTTIIVKIAIQGGIPRSLSQVMIRSIIASNPSVRLGADFKSTPAASQQISHVRFQKKAGDAGYPACQK